MRSDLGRSDQQLQEAYLSDARMGIEGASAEVFAATDAALREQQKHEKKRGMQGREEEPLDEEEHEETLDEEE